jgi:hypothetical protein
MSLRNRDSEELSRFETARKGTKTRFRLSAVFLSAMANTTERTYVSEARSSFTKRHERWYRFVICGHDTNLLLYG